MLPWQHEKFYTIVDFHCSQVILLLNIYSPFYIPDQLIFAFFIVTDNVFNVWSAFQYVLTSGHLVLIDWSRFRPSGVNGAANNTFGWPSLDMRLACGTEHVAFMWH